MDHNTFLNSICEQAEECELTLEQVKAIAADFASEFEARAQNRAEDAWERMCEDFYGGGGDETYRRDMKAAGRGHLLGG